MARFQICLIFTGSLYVVYILFKDDLIAISPLFLTYWRRLFMRYSNAPLILGYTKHFGNNDMSAFEHEFVNCKFPCRFSVDKRLLHEADAILFHGNNLNISELPVTTPDQIKALWVRESPDRSVSYFYYSWDEIPMSYFNTVLSYHRNSVYANAYDRLIPLTSESQPRWKLSEVDAAIAKKQRPVFMLTSHCNAQSNRDRIAQKLGTYMDLTLLGKCANVTCNRGSCEADAIQSHYFYLALENTICDDYITEKFFRLRRLIVPITLKRSLVSDWLAPADSFIAVDDFCSIEELAKYLKFLIDNPAAYRRYFNWTKYYQKFGPPKVQCDLCRDLHFKNVSVSNFSNFLSVRSYFPRSQCNNNYGQELFNRTCSR